MSLSFTLIRLSTLAYLHFYLLLSSLFLFFSLSSLFSQEMIEVFPAQDNILYESNTGHLSNGAGQFIFSGRTGQNNNGTRRAILQFDLQNALPEDAIVEEVELKLYVLASSSKVSNNFHLHRVQQSWGEGASDDAGNEGSGTEASGGDATWLHRFHDTLTWENPGGDFLMDTSAISLVDTTEGFKTWSSSPMIADVNHWLEHPDSNYGWILLGNEETKSTSRRFASKDHPDSSLLPRLVIRYTLSTNISPQSKNLRFNIYPNPNRGSFSLQLPSDLTQATNIRVFDMQGRLIYQQIHSQATYTPSIQLPTVPVGLYWTEIGSGNRWGIKKVYVKK